MKKCNIFSALTICLLAPVVSNAQMWTGGGASTYTMDNVGIGVSIAPSSLDPKLRVNADPGLGASPILALDGTTYPTNFLELWKSTSGVPDVVFDKNGWLGILTSSPTEPLHVQGNARLSGTAWIGQAKITLDARVGGVLGVQGGQIDMNQPSTDLPREIIANSTQESLNILSGHGLTDGAWIALSAIGQPVQRGGMNLHTVGSGNFAFYHYVGAQPNFLMKIDDPGDVTIQRHLTVNNTAWIGSLNVTHDTRVGGVLGVQGGRIDMNQPSSDVPRVITANSAASLMSMTAGNGGAYMTLHAGGNADPGAIEFITTGPTAIGGSTGTDFIHFNGVNHINNMRIYNDGKVAIGSNIITTNNVPNNYKLYVEDGILTEKVKVAVRTTTNWADYVFQDDYKLQSLSDVESFIKQNKHLPEIPSADEVVKEGIDVAEMNAKLLQKIEELTLYVINQQKQLDKQQREIETMKGK